jgi:tRNA(Ile)-lysidine synthase
MTLVARFTSTIARLRLPPGRAIVAVSGGVDSVVLLELLARTRERHGLSLVVAHIDHGIQPGEAPGRVVLAHAHRWGLPCVVRALDLGAGATETRAREARHVALRAVADEQDARWIFLAHHAGDQAETILMRLLRGSGPAGLRGMARRNGRLVRPLLHEARRDLIEFARAELLQWWDDPTNLDPRHLRSWLRHDLLPRIEARLPDMAERLGDAGRQMGRERRAWRATLRHWPGLGWDRADGVESVDWATLAGLPPEVRLALVRTCAREAGCRAGARQLHLGLEAVRGGASGAAADVGGGWRLELAFGRLRLTPPGPSAGTSIASTPIADPAGELDWGRWHLRWSREPAPAVQERATSTAWFVPGPLAIRPWRPGDRLLPLGGTGRRLAVRCFQDARIPKSERAGWPIIEAAGGVAWIPGVCRADLRVPAAGSSSLRLELSSHV